MSEELDKLSRLGVQKIYDETRIPAHHIQALLHSSFDGLSKVQFLGFVSILEREYDEKLTNLRQAGLAYFDEKDERNPNDSLFVVSHKKATKAPFYISIAVVLVIIALILNYFILNQDNLRQKNSIDNKLIENVQKNIIIPKTNVTEENMTNLVSDTNLSETQQSNNDLTQEKAIKSSFEIVPRTKVWLGYIDVNTSKKYQTTIDKEMNLDPNKRWLLVFGHGYIDMFINGEIQKFDSRNKTRFLYENQTLKAISSSEFKEFNRGSKW